tara:strand:+ start:418 stop:630 length:213 start_codon:yes stop_codon:yes gene_type:complete
MEFTYVLVAVMLNSENMHQQAEMKQPVRSLEACETVKALILKKPEQSIRNSDGTFTTWYVSAECEAINPE